MTSLGRLFYDGITTEGIPTFGVTLTALALLGAVLGRRRRPVRIWLVLWLGVAALALGSVPYLGTRGLTAADAGSWTDGVAADALHLVRPPARTVQLPGANPFTVLALVPAALLDGSAVDWIRQWFAPALVLVALVCVPELGWSSVAPYGTMATGLSAPPSGYRRHTAPHHGADGTGGALVARAVGWLTGFGRARVGG